MKQVREIALTVLNQCEASEQYSNIAVDHAIRRSALNPSDRALLTALVYGTLEKRLTLDAGIRHYATRTPEELEPDVRNLLRMGMYQMKFLDRIPDHAAVNETVNMAPRRARGFVNAVLRSFARGKKEIPVPNRESDPVGYLSVRYSFCREVTERFLSDYGFACTEQLFAAFGVQPPLTVRVNTTRIPREKLMQEWREAGISCNETSESPVGIRVNDRTPPTALPGFSDGLCFVQDEASQLAVEALDAHPGMQVLDTCACPGSKSFGAAINMQNCGSVLSCDLHGNKLSLIKEGAERLGLSVIETAERDARDFNADWAQTFDRVLCDVPCSGFGVFAKKPELRYKDPQTSARLPEIQRAILQTASSYVKKGGKLVYSTCTLLPAENQETVHAFLSENPDFSLLSMRTFFPDTDGTDGFFCAVTERK